MRWLHLDNGLKHPLFAPLLLAAVVLAAYYPSIGSGFHSIDDLGILALFSSPPPLSDILLPGRSYYYRPIIELSFYIDSKLWGMEPSVMHLENVLLHISNAIFVFMISRKLAAHYTDRNSFIPVLVALLFALHPLNVEAVTWVAGRTDPLAAFFILSACFFLLCWLDDHKWQYAVCTPFLFGLGVMTKETAMAFLPFAFMLLLVWPGGVPARRRLIAVGGIVVSGVLVVVVATLLWKGNVTSLGRFLAHNNSDVSEWWQNSLVAFGFYVKKLLMPLPLNFAITEVNPAYSLLGVLSFIALVVAFFKWRLPSLFFAASALMILPVLIVASKQIAWTPYAERYMYMPSAFLCIGATSLFLPLQERSRNRLARLIIIVVCISGVVSFQRNLLWKNKLAFYQDAAAKSPGFGSVYNELGGQYIQQGQYDKAADAFAVAERLNKRPSMIMLIKFNIMVVMVAKGNFIAARDYFFQLFAEKNAAPVNFLELLYTADSKRLESLKMEGKVPLVHDLLETLGLLYLKKPDPFWLYRSGQIALGIGMKNQAADFFRRAYVSAPLDAHYKGAAKTYYMRLEAGK